MRKRAVFAFLWLHAFSTRSHQPKGPLHNNELARQIMDSFPSSTEFVGNDVGNAMVCLARANVVCLDVDSTVLAYEGIDVLAEYLGRDIAELTNKAMDGSTKFEDATGEQLELLHPGKKQIEDCLKDHPPVLTEGMESFVRSMKDRNKKVYLVSGGFRIMIEPMAKERLGIDKSRIYANTLFFDHNGEYTGWDRNEPTSADMGKARVIHEIKKKHGHGAIVVMIGDGATDAQAKPPADAFIGFGGVVTRNAVKKKACWFVTDLADLEHVVTKFGWKRSNPSAGK